MSESAAAILNPPSDPAPVPAAPAANAAWWDSISDPEVKTWAANKKYESPEMLAKSAWSLERTFGADKAGRTVMLPKDDKDVEGYKTLYSKLGVPETPDGYKLPLPNGDDGVFAKAASAWFHEAGVPPRSADLIATKWNEYIAGEMAKAEQADQAAAGQKLQALKSEWGTQFDERTEYARRGFRSIGQDAGLDDQDLKKLESTIGTDKMLKMFWRLGEANKEGSFASTDGKGEFAIEASAAQKEFDQIQADRSAGKIGDYEWQKDYAPKGGKLDQLMAKITRSA